MTADPPTARARRADAERSRLRLLAVAAEAFARMDEPTLKDIASGAGVGIGTLFRHFPTREALVEAVYRAELARLCDSVDELLAGQPADRALRAWMVRWSEFVRTKRAMGAALTNLAAAGTVTRTETGARLTASIQRILDADAGTKTLRADVSAEDITTALTGILVATGSGQQPAQAARLLDLLLDGLTLTGPRGLRV